MHILQASTPAKNEYSKAAALVQDFFLGISVLLLGIQLLAWVYFLPEALRGHTSFRQLYTAGYMVRSGHASQLYDYNTQKHFQDGLVSQQPMLMPFIRPPFDAVVFVPFSLLPYRWAYIAFSIVSLGALGFSVRLLRPWTKNLESQTRSLPAMIFISFVPVAAALILGQDSILLLALLSASLLAMENEKNFVSGALAGLGLFKFHLVIPLALLMLVWRRFRFFAGFAATAVTLGLISLLVVPFAQIRFYLASLLTIGKGASAGAHELLRYPLPITMMATVHGLVVGFVGINLSPHAQTMLTAALALALLAAVAIMSPQACKPSSAMAIAITASVLASYYLFVYDLTILLLPLTIALNHATAPGPNRMRSALWTASALVVIAPAVMFFSIAHFFLVSLPVFFLLLVLARSTHNESRGAQAAA